MDGIALGLGATGLDDGKVDGKLPRHRDGSQRMTTMVFRSHGTEGLYDAGQVAVATKNRPPPGPTVRELRFVELPYMSTTWRV